MAGETKRDSRVATRLAKVLAHDLRLQIMRLSIERSTPVSPREASKELSAVLGTVAYHFDVLADVEALKPMGTGPARGVTQRFYAPNPSVVEMPMVKEILAATSAG